MKASIAAVLMVLGVSMSAAGQGVRPTPTIQIRVVDEQGAPVDAGRAVIDSLGRWVLIEKGLATITDLPEGTWTVSLRALGFRPENIAVATSVQQATPPVVTMHRIPQNLAPVAVTGVLTSKDSAKLRGIEQRMRTASGTLIMGDNLAVRNATLAAQALGAARGFTRKSETVVQARGGCRSIPRSDSLNVRAMMANKRRQKYVAVYLDGSRVPGGLESVNRMVPPSDILAIEAYPEVASAPFIWRTDDACAVVAYWTKKPPAVSVGR